jgi:hypothetical protein
MHPDGRQVVEAGFRFAHLGAIFIEGHIPHPVEPVLDAPVTPRQFENPLRAGLRRGKAGDPEG